jgi:hypothetical protein
MRLASEIVTMNAPYAAPGLGWERPALGRLVARFVDAGGFVVEVDGFAESEMGLGCGGLPRRRLALAPIDHVRAVLAAGLAFEGEYARRLAGECVVGGADFDYAPSVDLLDPRFNSLAENRLRVRTLDSHLKNLPQPSLLILAGEGGRPDIIRSGRKTIAEQGPIVALRSRRRADLDACFATLCEIDPGYEWIMPPEGGRDDGARTGDGAAYRVAVPARRRQAVETLLRGLRSGDPLRPAAAFRATLLLRFSPDTFIASSGLYAVETIDARVARWGGALPRLAALVEAPEPGPYEIRVLLARAVPGAVESVEGIRVNGALLSDPDRSPADLVFSVMSEIDRNVLIEIDCPRRQITPPDGRRLSLALSEIRLRRLPR